jgi:hypothetical protein
MSEFDDFDLGRRLRDAAGSEPDLTVAHDAVRHRVVRARRRRMAAVSGAAAAVVASIGLVAALGNEGEGRIETLESSPSVSQTVPVSTDEASTTTADGPTTSNPPGSTTASTVPQPTAPGVTTMPSGPAPTLAPTTLPGQDDPTTTSTVTPTTTPISVDTTTAAPADITQPFDSIGGSIVVRLSGGQMTLVSTSATTGYDTELHTEKPDDIEVRFRSGDAESRIRIRLIDGQMVPEIDEQ